jgi:hypothetical protein
VPYSTEFTADGLGLLQIGQGIVTGDDLIATTLLVSQARSQLSRVRYGLIDLSAATGFEVSLAYLVEVAHVDKELIATVSKNLAVAVVTAAGDGARLARTWQVLAAPTGWRIHVFGDRDAATAWLRSELPDVEVPR